MSALLNLIPSATPKVFRNGFEAYKLYTAVSLHITSNYDGIKYSFRKPVAKKWNEHSFPEKYAFDRIAKHIHPTEWILYFGKNCINANWVREFMGDEGEARLNQARGFLENPKKQFEAMFNSYLIMLHNRQIKYSESLKGETPLILQEFEQGRVSAEFVVLIDALTPFLETTDSLIYKDVAYRLFKYSKLFAVDKVLLKDVVKSACS